MIPGDLLSAFPHRQFHTLPGLLDSWAMGTTMTLLVKSLVSQPDHEPLFTRSKFIWIAIKKFCPMLTLDLHRDLDNVNPDIKVVCDVTMTEQ